MKRLSTKLLYIDCIYTLGSPKLLIIDKDIALTERVIWHILNTIKCAQSSPLNHGSLKPEANTDNQKYDKKMLDRKRFLMAFICSMCSICNEYFSISMVRESHHIN